MSRFDIRNDPLFSDDYQGGENLVEHGIRRVHTPEMTGLIPLLDHEYHTIGCGFAENVTLGMYRYYGSMLAWARALKVHMMNQYSYNEQMKRFVDVVQYGRFTAPKLLGSYINGMGNIHLPCGRLIRLKLPHFDLCKSESSGHGGYFGKIEDHVELYAQLISPGVLVDKIINDLVGTPGDWDLPDDFRMDNHAINQNCLGYEPVQSARSTALHTYASLHITRDSFPTEFPEFCYNPDLMEMIMNQLKVIKNRELKEINLRTPDGSIGQIMTAEFIDSEEKQIVLQKWKGVSPVCMSPQIFNLGCTFLYRRRIEKRHALMPNNFNSDNEIPETYFNQFERFHAADHPIIGIKHFAGIDYSLHYMLVNLNNVMYK